ncbi:hypothetical protein [uncultured Bartonella sp.]|uniref:gp53-like domain-containing protein n=1 Tax=uncultured Bartonella sp. TaxID=104108 RepID=UPI0025F66849|nr:hypothetical protein [uncultured Bartonella sp.]
MAVPYHTHTFEIPIATPQDMAARASSDKAVTPSVLGTAATADRSEFATAEQGKRADSAVQPETLGTLARKNKVVLTEIETNGLPSNTTFLSGNGWQSLTGDGDMTIAVYDPSGKRTDAFDMGAMKETSNAKIMTADERRKLANINALAASLWNAGADGTEALVSPVKLRDAINARFGGNPASGWTRMPNGMLIQWGNAAVASGNGYWQIFFPTAFTKKGIFLPTIATEWTGEWFAPIVFTAASDNTNLNMRGLHLRQTTGTNSVSYLNSCNVQWLAIGY